VDFCVKDSVRWMGIVSKEKEIYNIYFNLVDDHCDFWIVFVSWLFWRQEHVELEDLELLGLFFVSSREYDRPVSSKSQLLGSLRCF